MVRTRVGYAGGTTSAPTYRSIGDHTEAIQIDYDPAVISYEQLLDVFWRGHDPCRAAWSTQYKAILFHHDDEQKRLALASRDREAARRGAPIRTELVAAPTFHRAEDYHQKYYLRQRRAVASALLEIGGGDDGFTDSTAAARANAWAGGNLSFADLRRELGDLGLDVRGGDGDARVERRTAGSAPR